MMKVENDLQWENQGNLNKVCIFDNSIIGMAISFDNSTVVI